MKFFKILTIYFLMVFLSNCQTIEKKTQETLKKEEKKLSQFLNKPESELKINLGKPDKVVFDDNGSEFYVYYKKKYRITCERKFEINEKRVVIGFSSKGCF